MPDPSEQPAPVLPIPATPEDEMLMEELRDAAMTEQPRGKIVVPMKHWY